MELIPVLGDLDSECGCDGWELPCRHAAAVGYQLAWLIDADPFLIFLLRGRDRNRLLDELRAASAPRERSTEHDRPVGTPAIAAYSRVAGALPAIPAPGSPVPVTRKSYADVVETAAERARRALLTSSGAIR